MNAYKLEKQFAEQMENVFRNAARFRWNSDMLHKGINSILEDSKYQTMPRYAKSFVEGVAWHLYREHRKLLEFSYEINGVRMMITEDRYRKVSPREVHEKWGKTGCHVYKEDPSVLFNEPLSESKVETSHATT